MPPASRSCWRATSTSGWTRAPGRSDLEQLDEFGFHKLALEDNRKFGQRPKLDDYGDYVFVVYYGVAPPEESPDLADPVLVEVHLYVSGGYVVTAAPVLSRAGRAQAGNRQHPPRSEEFLVYRISIPHRHLLPGAGRDRQRDRPARGPPDPGARRGRGPADLPAQAPAGDAAPEDRHPSGTCSPARWTRSASAGTADRYARLLPQRL